MSCVLMITATAQSPTLQSNHRGDRLGGGLLQNHQQGCFARELGLALDEQFGKRQSIGSFQPGQRANDLLSGAAVRATGATTPVAVARSRSPSTLPSLASSANSMVADPAFTTNSIGRVAAVGGQSHRFVRIMQ